MGSRGPVAKSPERAQGHRQRKPALAEVTLIPITETPEPPPGLSHGVLDAWESYWRSDVAQATSEVDLPAVHRLFLMYEQHARATAAAQETLAVAGSKGQPRLNPLADYALKLETAILRLETELGKTPLARQRLGIAVGQAKLTLSEINRRASEGVTHADPRLTLASTQ